MDTLPAKQSFFAGIIVTIIILLVELIKSIIGNSILFNFSAIIFVLFLSSIFIFIYKETLYTERNRLFINWKKYRKFGLFIFLTGLLLLFWLGIFYFYL